jgi:hypothetical protein
MRRFHAWATIVWVVLAAPTVLWWRESVFWVNVMSWYAIVVSHAAAWQATRAEEAVEQNGPAEG